MGCLIPAGTGFEYYRHVRSGERAAAAADSGGRGRRIPVAARPILDARHTTSGVRVYSSRKALMPNTSARTIVHSHPDILSGTPVFVGTRVPAQSLFDYLEGGDTLDEFLRQFPSVSREQAIAALELAKESVLTRARTT